ncbi:CRE-NLP-42 protein [Ditylenchus destructor]|nr:CRE-NLP-42 protein [Ditylenchus destructor]
MTSLKGPLEGHVSEIMKSQSQIGPMSSSASMHLFRFLLCAILLRVATAWTSYSHHPRQLILFNTDRSDVGTTGSSPGNELVKKSETPQWDDLGWAWGKKRSDLSFHGPPVQDSEQPQTSRSVGTRMGGLSATQLRALQSLVKKENPDWNDLGWAWGR